MITANQRSVNVNRLQLLECLKKNLEIHKKDYQEALVGYKVKLEKDLTDALESLSSLKETELKGFNVEFQHPVSHENSYVEVIEMMEMSVDENINLDSQSFRAFIKNDWPWSINFNSTTTLYKSYAVGASLS